MEMTKNTLVDTALILGHDIVRVYANPSTYTPSTPYSDTMKRVSQELYQRHNILFDSMVKRYRPGLFVAIAEELFSDDKINWGRIISLYTLCGLLAQHYKKELLPLCMSHFFRRNLAAWVSDVGGFDNLLEEYSERIEEDISFLGHLVLAPLGLITWFLESALDFLSIQHEV